MTFNDLEKKFRGFFQRQPRSQGAIDRKPFVGQQVLRAYKQQFAQPKLNFISLLLKRQELRWASALGVLFMFIGFSSWTNQTAIAGDIEPKFGQVAVIRDGKTKFITEKTKLKVGDIVQVADDSRARVVLPDKLISTVRSGSELRVMDTDKVYLASGSAEHRLTAQAEVSTVRGIVRTADQARINTEVLATGETRFGVLEHAAEVADWLNGRKALTAGEELRLLSDTGRLENQAIPEINLSSAQLKAIDSKLAVARAQFFGGVEEEITHQGQGYDRIIAAQKTFRSTVQILNTDRQLNVLKRINEDYLVNADVVHRLEARTDNPNILAKARALTALFETYQTNEITLELPRGESTLFNRYVLVDQIFQDGNQIHAKVLKEEYVLAALRKIINQEIKMDQVLALSEEVQKLPNQNSKAISYLQTLQSYLDPYLADILEEKITALQTV